MFSFLIVYGVKFIEKWWLFVYFLKKCQRCVFHSCVFVFHMNPTI